MGDPGLGQLEELVVDFFRAPTSDKDRLLREFQGSVEAWSVSVQLLGSSHAQVCAFAASTLKNRARRDAPSVLHDVRGQRVRELLALLGRGLPALTRGSLSVAIAVLCCVPGGPAQLVSEGLFLQLGPVEQLEVLALLAQECHAMDAPQSQREVMARELRALAPHVLRAIAGGLSQSVSAGVAAVTCVEKWCAFGIDLRALGDSGVLGAMLEVLGHTDSELFGTVARSLAAVCTGSSGTAPADLYEPLLAAALQLSTQLECALAEGDDDWCLDCTELLVAIGKAFRGPVSAGVGRGSELVDMGVAMTQYGPLPCAEAVLDLWDALLSVPRPADRVDWRTVMSGMVGRCTYPSDFPGTWQSYYELDRDDFERYRSAAAETMAEVCAVLGHVAALKQLLALIDGGAAWQRLEVALFGVAACAPEIVGDDDEGTAVSADVDALLHAVLGAAAAPAAPKHELVVLAMLRALEAYSMWASQSQAVTGAAVQYALHGLGKAGTRAAAASMLRVTCTRAGSRLARSDLAEQLCAGLQTGDILSVGADVGTAAMRLAAVTANDSVRLQRVAALLSAVTNHVTDPAADVAHVTAALNTLAPMLQRCGAESHHAVRSVAEALLPRGQQLWEQYAREHEDLRAAHCDSLRACVLAGAEALADLVPVLLATVAAMLNSLLAPQCLDVLKAVAEKHGRNAGLAGSLSSFVEQSTPLLTACLQTDGDAEFVAAYFSFLQHTLVYADTVLAPSPVLPVLLNLATICLQVWDPEAFRRVTEFVTQALQRGRADLIDAWISEHGHELARTLLAALGDTTRRSDVVGHVTEPLHALLKRGGDRALDQVFQGVCGVSGAGPAAQKLCTTLARMGSIPAVAAACTTFRDDCRDAARA